MGRFRGRDVEEMWGFRSPTPRGRTESCTLRILTDALTGAHEKRSARGEEVGDGAPRRGGGARVRPYQPTGTLRSPLP